MPALTPLARKLRSNPTEAEKQLWRYLRMAQFHGLKFRRQYVIDKYIADFVCLPKRIVIELDGGQHSETVTEDLLRTRAMEAAGFKIIRYWNNDVINNIEGVLQDLETHLNLSPPPEGEG